MREREAEWTARHIAAFRTCRGHGPCLVKGCTGSQPLVSVQTRAQWLESLRLAALPRDLNPRRAVDLPPLHSPRPKPSDLLPPLRWREPSEHRNHVHIAGPSHG